MSSESSTSGVDPLNLAHLALRADVKSFIARRVEPSAIDDLVQEVFLRVHERAEGLRDTERLAPWLFTIARNVVVDHLRKKKTRKHAPLDEAHEPLTGEPEQTSMRRCWLGSSR